eukprot:snap_masked-scaffold_9-processed-gene-5.27-mRNA-1 protein AED:1.00 eAED:1.00 QI:0/0/0/0/1/1/2/0/82
MTVIKRIFKLNIEKYNLIPQSAVCCEQIHRNMAIKQLEKQKLCYVHELAPLIYLENRVSQLLPGFSELRKKMTRACIIMVDL